MKYLNDMDFKGQILAERLYQSIILIVSIIGFIHGYYEQSFMITFRYWLGSTIFSALLTIPGWPWLYQKHPVKWLKELPSPSSSSASTTTTNTGTVVNPTLTTTTGKTGTAVPIKK